MTVTPNPIVSVVIPMYNAQAYIKQCLDSVLAQTYKHFEVLCVDDGCTDNTLAILATYEDKRIRLIQQQNRGLSGARNTGIEASRGLYVALLDADDFWHPEKLAHHVSHLNHYPKVGVSYCPSVLVDEQGTPMGIEQRPRLSNISAAHVFCRNPVGNGSAAVIRRALLSEMGRFGEGKDALRRFYFDENLRQSEDIEFWTRIALQTRWQFAGVRKALTYYRINEQGLSANLYKQLASWQKAFAAMRIKHPAFFKKYYRLAQAYQYRYLARRAVQNRSRLAALYFMHRALVCNSNILFQEPKRTLVTFACSWLNLLPTPFYNAMEKAGMAMAQSR